MQRRTWVAWLWAAWLAYTACLGVLHALLPASPDQAIFDYIGWRLVQGDRLYLDVAEQNFPGIMWLHAAANWLFGNRSWSFRAFDYLLLLPFCFLLVGVVRRAGVGGLAWLAAPLYQAMYVTSGIWSAGCRDLIAAHALVVAGFCQLQRCSGRSRLWLAGSGTAIAFALLVRPTCAVFPVLLVGIDAVMAIGRLRPWRAVIEDAVVLAGWSLVWMGALAALGAATGQLQEWYRLTIEFNLGVYSHSASFAHVASVLFSFVDSWHWYLAFGACGAVLWWWGGSDRRLWAMVIAVWVTAVVSAFVQRKGFGYHFVGMLPALAVFAAYFVAWTLRSATRRRSVPSVAFAAAVGAIAILGLGSKMRTQLGPQAAWVLGMRDRESMFDAHGYGDTWRVGRELAETTGSHERVLVWSRAVHVNYLARRRSTSRFITVWMLDGIPPEFALGREWIDEFESAFLADPPAAIVLDAPADAGEGLLARQAPSAVVQFVRDQIETHYELGTRSGLLAIYRRR